MRRAGLLVAFVAVIAIARVAGQDVIYRNDGSEIKAKVVEITTDAIKYRNFDQPSGPIRNILTSDVFMIIYEDGTKEVYKKPSDNSMKEGQQNPKSSSDGSSYALKPGKSSRISIAAGAKGGVYIPVDDVLNDIYGITFRVEADMDFWGQNGAGGGIGVGFTQKEGDPYVYGQVTNATTRITFIPIHISSGYRVQNNLKVMPYFMTSLVITPFHEILEGDFYTGNGYEHLSNEASETAVGFNIIAGLQVKPAYIEAIFSYEKYKETNVGGFVVAAGFKF